MTALSPSPNLLDDPELLRVSTTPRGRLFQSLNRASAFAPLIMVCCVLPAVQLLAKPTLDEVASLWGLRALAVANASSPYEFLEPGVNEPGQPLIFQPPLSPWLNGIVIRILGPSHPLSTSLVSLIATGITIWLTTRMAWRIGGANTALVSALLTCCHPQTLELAISPSNGSLGVCLMLASIFGFQRHLEGKWVHVSPSLFISGIVWGLSLLAIGPVAFTIPLLFALHALNQRSGNQPEFANPSFRDQLLQSRLVLRSTMFLVATGFLVGGWWGIIMVSSHGMDGFRSWWTSLPVECLAPGNSEWQCDLRPLIQPTWHDWLQQQSLVIAWLIVGLERSWHLFRRPGSELVRRRYQLLLFWWTVVFVGLSLAEFVGQTSIANTEIWTFALLSPTVLLASLGIGTLIERDVTRRGELFLIILLVSLTFARISMSLLVGLAGGALSATFLVCGPMLMPSAGRTEHGWSEEGWRRLLQITVYGALIACLSVGLGFRSIVSEDEHRLADLRDRLKSFPEVRRISLIATRDPVPVTLRHLLRCRWPKAKLVTSEGWDVGLTAAMNEESESPTSKFLILEWTRRDVRFSADTGQSWRIKAVGDPMRFHGRRLSMILIEPRL